MAGGHTHTVTDSYGSAVTATLSMAVTGTNPFLWVETPQHESPNQTNNVTWNGTSLTQLTAVAQGGSDSGGWWYLENPTVSASANLRVIMSTSTEGGTIASVYTGIAQASAIPTWDINEASSRTATIGMTTTQPEVVVIAGGFHAAYGDTMDPFDSQNERADFLAGSGIAVRGFSGDIVVTSPAYQRMAWDANDGSDAYGMIIAELIQAGEVEQEGYRFRNDDGSESAATWAANQDTDASVDDDTNFRLRMLLNGTDDPASQQYRLDYKLSTDSEYDPILTTAGDGQTGTISFVNVGTANSGAAISAVSPGLPASMQADDFMIAWCVNSENTGAKTWDDDGGGGNGWTLLTQQRTTSGRDREDAVYYKKHSGSESAPTFSIGGGGSPTSGRIAAWRGVDTTTPFDVTFDAGSHFLAADNDPHPVVPSITTAEDGAVVVLLDHITHDDITTSAAPSGYTLRSEISGGTVDHYQQHIADRTIATAGAESPEDWQHSVSSTAGESHAITLALKPQQPTGTPIYVATSANVSANGEDTTAQLTAPSGKTTGDFDAGRMQDDENPADAVDITADDYTEMEWCLQADSANVSNGEKYDFRVTVGGAALKTYTVNPQVTIDTGEEVATAVTPTLTMMGV